MFNVQNIRISKYLNFIREFSFLCILLVLAAFAEVDHLRNEFPRPVGIVAAEPQAKVPEISEDPLEALSAKEILHLYPPAQVSYQGSLLEVKFWIKDH